MLQKYILRVELGDYSIVDGKAVQEMKKDLTQGEMCFIFINMSIKDVYNYLPTRPVERHK